ncbi:MAG TPA: ArsB/NhaD family transporter [Kofleriaceae bacterium]|nr:ArsB/NhaD family transporter [Kofleriaceae bacterium]
MMAAAIGALAATLVIALSWRNAWAPAVGALLGVAIAFVGGAASTADVEHAARDLWRPLLVIISIMTTAACASELGVFAYLAEWIEPRTRGPVRHAFRLVFVLAALCAAVLSNDAAILMFTPVVIELLRQVYPKRHGKFVHAFAFAVFVAAGVAPLATGNPMNLVVAQRAGIGFNEYARHMIPVALVGWIVAYLALAWYFRAELADEAPAKGGRLPTVQPVDGPARIVLFATAGSILAYPILAALHQPLWTVAVPTAIICTMAATRRDVPVTRILREISWELIPFVFGVLVLATALARVGVTDSLAQIYARSSAPLPTVGAVAAVGSALINNHPMALLHSVALAGEPHSLVYAALIGGDLGPRLLPIGSLAGLLWLHTLRVRGVVIPFGLFIRVGLVVTIPSLLVSLATLWLLA